MAQGYRPDRVGDQLRAELSTLLARDVHDPGIGFITLTRVNVSPDLQFARVYYTIIGDDRARVDTAKALERVAPFLRRELGRRLRLKRAPRLVFVFDESVGGQDRIERLLQEIHTSETEVDRREDDDSGEPER
jgi:ribosome-binding factor A